MLINKDIPDNDKIILTALGKNADTPLSDLLASTKYKRKSSLYNRIRNLREEKYLFGPYYDINYNAIGKNKLYTVFVLAEYRRAHRDVVFQAMKKINCYTMLYPVRTADVYIGVYRCNNWNDVASLFGLMKTWGWLKGYAVHRSECRWVAQNPNMFGDFMPPPGYQAPSGPLPSNEYEEGDEDIAFTKTDLIVLKHVSAKTCHLTEIRDIEYRYYGLKMKYDDLKKSYQNLRQYGVLLQKEFVVFPLPLDSCSLFFLISEGKNVGAHTEMVAHFGEGMRLTKRFIMAGRVAISYFSTHPLLEGKILGMVEDNVKSANVYGIKTYPSTELSTKTFNDDFFDVDSQRWVFPYAAFVEGIKELKETGS